MDYYDKKAQVEAMLRKWAPPLGLRGYFRVVKEAYAHNRNDLALCLCHALVLTGNRRGPAVGQAHRSRDGPGAPAPDDGTALEAIRAALEGARDRGRPTLVWIHFPTT